MPIEILGARYISPQLGSFIRAASKFDEDKLSHVPANKAISIRIEVAQTPKLRQFYWGLISKLVDGGIYAGRDAAHADIMVKTGRVGSVLVSGQTIRLEPVSTKEWDGIEWRDFINAAIPFITTHLIPDIRFPDFRSEVERYVGARLSDAMKEAEYV